MTYLRRPACGLIHATGVNNQSTVAAVKFDQTADSGAIYDGSSTSFEIPILGISRICANEGYTGDALRLSQYCISTNETNTTDRKYVFSGRTCDETDTQYLKGDSESYGRSATIAVIENYTAVSSRKFSWLNWTHLEYYRVTS